MSGTTIVGTGSADVLFGTPGTDTINGLGGDDTMVGAGGNDLLDGGAGDGDVASYLFSSIDPNTAIALSGNGFAVNAGALEGVDQLENVEIVTDQNGDRTLLVGNGGFTTIQDAVEAAQEGDTILIAEGTYAEQVVIASLTDVRLVGLGEVTITPPDGTIAITGTDPRNGRKYTAVVSVLDSDGIGIENVTVDGERRANEGAAGFNDYAGILVVNSTGTEIDAVTVTGIRDPFENGTVSGVQRGQGIVVSNAAGSETNTFSLTNSTIEDFQKTALIARGTTVTVTGNVVDSAGPLPGIAQNGFQFSQGASGTVSGNEITGIGYSGPADAVATGIFVIGSTAGMTVSGNTLSGTDTGSTGGDVGIWAINSRNVTVTGNTLEAFDSGTIDQGDPNFPVSFGGNPELDGSNSFTGNTYTGTDVNHSFDPAGTETVNFSPDATDGADSLTGALGDDTLEGLAGNDTLEGAGGDDSLLGGAGDDELSGGGGFDTAVYSATITTDEITSTDDGWQVDALAENMDLLVGVEAIDADGPGGTRILLVDPDNGGFATIQDAVDAAVAGDIVFVANGFYEEQVTITKAITLRGESRSGVVVRAPDSPVGGQTFFDLDLSAVIAVADTSGAVVEDLTVDGDNRAQQAVQGNGAIDFYGILFLRASGGIDNVTVTGVRSPDDGFGLQIGQGIATFSETDKTTFSVTNSRIENFQKSGILLDNADVTISGNEVVGVGATALIAQNGIQAGFEVSGTISGNTVSDIGYTVDNGTETAGIIVSDTGGPLAITANGISGAPDSFTVGVYLTDAIGVSVTGNALSQLGTGIVDEDEPADFTDFDPDNLNVVEPNTLTDVGTAFRFDPEADNFVPPGPATTTADFRVDGTVGNDDLRGGSGDDTLGGSAGADTLTGRLGNDVYFVNATSTVVEQANEGTDRVEAGVTISALFDNVENLTLTGTGNIDGTGNALANMIVGNVGNNVLTGLAGNGTLLGGLGNDTYVVAQGDTVTELANQGIDTVQSSVTFRLANAGQTENLVLTGSGNINGGGNALGNSLTGNAGNNRLKGAGGQDVLVGDVGRDRYTGGTGADIFRFNKVADSGNTPTSADIILDFQKAQGDRIDLSNIDANPATTPDNAFTFIGTAAFSDVGQVRAVQSGGFINVEVNTDTNFDTVEMLIRLDDLVTLQASDFIFV